MPLVLAGDHRWRLPLYAPPARRGSPLERPATQHRAAWTCRAGWGRLQPQGCPRARASGRSVVAGRGEDDKGMAQAHKGELRRCYAHVAVATTPRVVDLIEYEAFLATTGWGHGRWDGHELEMPEDTRHDRLLSDDGNDTQRAPAAKGTGAHIQPKDAAQQPGPRPVGGARVRFLPVQPLLARGGTDRPPQGAVRRQAAAVAYQVARREGDERGPLLQERQRREGEAGGPVRP